MYGRELWKLSTDSINDFCIAWRKGLRRVWGVPYDTHCYLLPLLSQCLPVFEEICKRSMNFIATCCSHTSALVRSVATHGLTARYSSVVGHNAAFCIRRFDCTLDDMYCGRAHDVVSRYFHGLTDEPQLRTACFLREVIDVRDHTLVLSNDVGFSRYELDTLIAHLCTN